ncbi:hypothetical protein B296_00023346, partial [Ensete ventricosum]
MRNRSVTVDFDRRRLQAISAEGGRKKKREKKRSSLSRRREKEEEEPGFIHASCNPSLAGDFSSPRGRRNISPCGENERCD